MGRPSTEAVAEEVPAKGFKHDRIYVLNLASAQREGGGLTACRQKGHSGSKGKNEALSKAVTRDDYI